ncbi:MAG: glycosyltransferase, partial [Lentisphaeria bacterium]|nr:glycosyltransferase [Lentisphaeria bacterium]
MKISVIIATFHGEKYISEQLLSLFRQTMIPDEILIGDDSGNRKTLDKISRIRKLFPGELQMIKNPFRLGIVKNYQNLARHASGDVIFFCDQDDFWLPRKIEKMVDSLENHPEKMVTVCNSEITDENLIPRHKLLLERTSSFYKFTTGLEQGTWQSFQDIYLQKYNFPAHNMAMRKEFRDLFAEMPEDYLYHDIWLAQISSLAGKLLYRDEILTRYRVHEKNASRFSAGKKNIFQEWISLFSHPTAEIEKSMSRLNYMYQIASGEKYQALFAATDLEKLKSFAEYFRKRTVLHACRRV